MPRPPSARAAQRSKNAPPSNSTTWYVVGAVLALIFVTAFVYSPVRSYEFVNWDDGLITTNPEVSHGLTPHSIFWAVTTTYAGEWIPLTWLSRLADVSLFGFWAGGHHLTNLVLHLINVVLLFVTFARMTGSLTRSWLVAALFALHPMNVGAVAWVIERKGILCATFFILAMWAYHAYVNRPQRMRYLLLIFLMSLSVIAKPMAVTLPIVLLLVDVWPLKRIAPTIAGWREWLPLVREKLPLVGVAFVASVITFEAERRSGVLPSREMYPWTLRLGNVLISYVRYITKMCWPQDLAGFYPLRPSSHLIGASLSQLPHCSWPFRGWWRDGRRHAPIS